MRVSHNFGSFIATRIRIRIIDTHPDPGGKMMRIRPDPNPHHCLEYHIFENRNYTLVQREQIITTSKA